MTYTATITIKDEKGAKIYEANLENGESKKGTFVTLAPKAENKVIPFGKLYFAPKAVTKAAK